MIAIYNLLPRQCTDLNMIKTLISNAAKSGFDTIQLHPVFITGSSNSLYAQTGELDFDQKSFPPELETFEERREFLKEIIEFSHICGLRIISDAVCNHLSFDSPYIFDPVYQRMFRRDIEGNCVHPIDSSNNVYRDIVTLDYDNPLTFEFMYNRLRFMLDLGVDGFRADFASYMPPHAWKTMITRARKEYDKPLTFIAESFGSDFNTRRSLINQGFDYVFTSSFWYRFDDSSNWLTEELNAFPSVAIASNHDQKRLMNKLYSEDDKPFDPDHEKLVRQFLAFSALIAPGFSITQGDEYGVQRDLNTFDDTKITEDDYTTDFLPLLTKVLDFKRRYGVEGQTVTAKYNGKISCAFSILNSVSDGIVFVVNHSGKDSYFRLSKKAVRLKPYDLVAFGLNNGKIDDIMSLTEEMAA